MRNLKILICSLITVISDISDDSKNYIDNFYQRQIEFNRHWFY